MAQMNAKAVRYFGEPGRVFVETDGKTFGPFTKMEDARQILAQGCWTCGHLHGITNPTPRTRPCSCVCHD